MLPWDPPHPSPANLLQINGEGLNRTEGDLGGLLLLEPRKNMISLEWQGTSERGGEFELESPKQVVGGSSPSAPAKRFARFIKSFRRSDREIVRHYSTDLQPQPRPDDKDVPILDQTGG